MNNQTKQNICPNCEFENDFKAQTCEICKTSLTLNIPSNISKIDEYRTQKVEKLTNSKQTRATNNFVINFDKLNINNQQELKKPINLIGLALLGLGAFLWLSYLVTSQTNTVAVKPTVEQEAIQTPQGVFSYGGAPIFAPLVASGVNGLMEAAHPGYELRYTKPINGDYSSAKGIQMLVDSELSFAYNDRPLNDGEYKKAQLRNFNLKQIPIALDGVVVYANKNNKMGQLNVAQIQQIFSGDITNWQELDPTNDNLPIVPVLVQNENLDFFGLMGSFPAATQFTPNYTQALRAVIREPGAISFASGTIAKNQQLIKMFSIADGSSQNYIDPIAGDNLNAKAFKSGEYPLTRRIFLVSREDDTLDQEAALLYRDFLASPQGQEKIEDAGLIPILRAEK